MTYFARFPHRRSALFIRSHKTWSDSRCIEDMRSAQETNVDAGKQSCFCSLVVAKSSVSTIPSSSYRVSKYPPVTSCSKPRDFRSRTG
jgi:hypothetical protein